MPWPQEVIPDVDTLYMRVHARSLVNGGLHPGIFREHGGGMSMDWKRSSTPLECRDRPKAVPPEINGVLEFVAGEIRQVEPLTVIHQPDEANQNRAHSNVYGLSSDQNKHKTRIRLQLFELVKDWVLAPKSSST